MTAAIPTRDPERAHPRRMAALLVLTPLIASIGFLLGIAWGLRGDDVPMLGLALATAALGFVPLILDQGRRPSDRHILLSMLSLLFVFSFVVPAFVIFLPTDWPVDAPSYSFSNLFPRDVIRGQLTALLGLFCLLIGYALPLGRGLAVPIPRFRTDWTLLQSLVLAGLMIPLGWAIMLASLLGLVSSSLGSGVIGVLASSYVYGIALLTIAMLRHRSRRALLLLAIVIPATTVFGFFTASKGAMLISGAMVFLAVVVVRRRIALRWVLAGIVATALVYPVGMFMRIDVLNNNTLTVLDALRDPADTLQRVSTFLSSNRVGDYALEGLMSTAGRFDSLGAASVLIRDTPRVSPFQNGKTLGLFFVAFVPRVLWPHKPEITIGRFITDTYGSGPDVESSTAPSQIGDFYMNFGYTGVVAGMLIVGVLFRIAHEVLLRGRPTTPALFAAVVILHYLGLNFQDNVAHMYGVALWEIGVIAIVHVALTLMSPRARSARGPGVAPGMAELDTRSG